MSSACHWIQCLIAFNDRQPLGRMAWRHSRPGAVECLLFAREEGRTASNHAIDRAQPRERFRVARRNLGEQAVTGMGIGATIVPSMAAAFQALSRAETPRATSALNAIQRIAGTTATATARVIALSRAQPRSDAAGPAGR